MNDNSMLIPRSSDPEYYTDAEELELEKKIEEAKDMAAANSVGDSSYYLTQEAFEECAPEFKVLMDFAGKIDQPGNLAEGYLKAFHTRMTEKLKNACTVMAEESATEVFNKYRNMDVFDRGEI